MADTGIWSGFKLMDPEAGSGVSVLPMDMSREGSVSGSSYSGMSSYSGSASGSTSTMSTTGTDEQGNDIVIALERRSVQPFRTQDEYLYAMKEDLGEWFNVLYQLNINVDTFFEEIETGVLLCEHANAVQEVIKNSFMDDNPRSYNPRATPIHMADYYVTYRRGVKPGTFQSRDNISNFLTWCVRLGIPDNLRFETDDLVMRKHERNVILCLLEVARRGAKYGMLAPMLVQMEEEIDAEIAATETDGEVETEEEMVVEYVPVEYVAPVQRITCDLMSLDEMVRNMVSQCTCPSQFPMVKVSDGKYRIGDSRTLIFVRILRNHVMVRIGGGWDTLENYLDRHDPCRCHARGGHSHGVHSGGHAPPPGRGTRPSPAAVQMSRRASAPTAPGLTGLEIRGGREAAIAEETERQPRRKPTTEHLVKQATAVLRGTTAHSNKSVTLTGTTRRTSLAATTPTRGKPPPGNRTASPAPRTASPAPRGSSPRAGSPSPRIARTGSPSPRAVSPARQSGGPNRLIQTPPRKAKRTLPSVPAETTPPKPTSSPEKTTIHISSSHNNNPVSRPRSALERRHSEAGRQYWRWEGEEEVSECLPPQHPSPRPRQRPPAGDRGRRSPSPALPEHKHTGGHDDLLLISRDDTGRHRIGLSNTTNPNPSDSPMDAVATNGGTPHPGLQRTVSANKFQISPGQLLPSKPKHMTRSASQSSESDTLTNGFSVNADVWRYKTQYSGESDSYSESNSSVTNGSSNGAYSVSSNGAHSVSSTAMSVSDNSRSVNGTSAMSSRTMSQGSVQSIDASDFETSYHQQVENNNNIPSPGHNIPGDDGLLATSGNSDKLSSSLHSASSFSLEVHEYPEAPPEDLELNKQMELLFQEYKKIERRSKLKAGGASCDDTLDEKGGDPLGYSMPRGVRTMPGTPLRGAGRSKQDFTQVKSKLKEYLMSSPSSGRNVSSTPRQSRTTTAHHPQRRSVTPNPSSVTSSGYGGSGRRTPGPGEGRATTPTPQRRNLPRAPSSGASTPRSPSTQSLSSQSAFSVVTRNPMQPDLGAVTASSATTAWRHQAGEREAERATVVTKNPMMPNLKGVTASSATSAWRVQPRNNDLTNNCDNNYGSQSASNSPVKRPMSARPYTPTTPRPTPRSTTPGPTPRSTTPRSTPRNMPATPCPAAKEVVRNKPPIFRPASAPMYRRGSRDDGLEPSTTGQEGTGGGFTVQSCGAWAAPGTTPQDTANKQQHSTSSHKSKMAAGTDSKSKMAAGDKMKSRSVPQTPVKASHSTGVSPAQPATPQRTRAHSTTWSGSNMLGSSLRCRSTTCLATTSAEMTLVDVPANKIVYAKDDLTTQTERRDSLDDEMRLAARIAAAAQERKDDRGGPRTRIPQPVSRRCKSADPYSAQLKRCDSGVDITNMSPTGEVGRVEAGEAWGDSEGIALSPQALAQYSPFDDNTEFF